jgi:hypothetical protein
MHKEYSGPGEVTPRLRERLRIIMRRYIAFGEIGIGQEYLWVPAYELNHDLAMHFGREVKFADLLTDGNWNDVLDAVEIFLGVARAEAYKRYSEIWSEIAQAFDLSGSVYYVTREGEVALHTEEETGKRIGQAVKALSGIDKAKDVLQRAAAGLIGRRMRPEDVIKDTCVALEEFLKEKTKENDLSGAVKVLRKRGVLTPTQAQIIERLYGFRSEVFGAAHAGEARTPTESDALWFLDTVSAQILFLDTMLK